MSMRSVAYWIEHLDLVPHPGFETGFLSRKVHEHELQVESITGHYRPAATNVYFLHQTASTPLDDTTMFFRLKSCEMLHFYTGKTLTIHYMPDPKTAKLETMRLGPNTEAGDHYFVCVPAHRWFLRRLEPQHTDDDDESYALIGCTVVPGYSDSDVETATLGEIKGRIEKETAAPKLRILRTFLS